MKVTSSQHPYRAISATLSTDHAMNTDRAMSSYGVPVLVLEGGLALGTADAALAGYAILEATADERAALEAAGYRLREAREPHEKPG